jgi:hypothetical protein
LSLNKGIPSNIDLNQLEEHWKKCHQTHPHALTILTKLFRNMDEVKKFFVFFLKLNFVYLVIKI